MNTKAIIERLAAHRSVGGAPREELEWIATHGTFRVFRAGEIVARETDTIDEMYILLAGRVAIWMNRTGGRRKFMDWGAGDVTGLLPYSRLRHPPGDTIAEEEVEAIALGREQLPELTRNCHNVTATLVHTMTDRARQFTTGDLRDEKLVSLGKLAAGLAHELNNPASALMRDAKSMSGILASASECARRLIAARLSAVQLAELDRARAVVERAGAENAPSGLALADREEEIAAWLASHRMAEEIAPDLAKTSIDLPALDRLAGVFAEKDLNTALRSIAAGHSVRSLAEGLERAAMRIHSLVTSVKRFTHMDREIDRGPVDIGVGLADTVALLAGKARSRSVTITLNVPPGLPPAYGVSAEVNQIWMNLVDNAIDALAGGGEVTITASKESSLIVVCVEDNGPGIPEEIVGRIFDPFFTTKQVGEGTGLGLDIVRRIVELHRGTITVSSRPGSTEFRVSLPAHE